MAASHSNPTVLTDVYEACVIMGDVIRRDPDGLGHSELKSIGLFLDVQDAKKSSAKAAKKLPGALGACTRSQHIVKDEPGPLHSKPERRFAIYEVPSDYMRPTFEPGDLVEIDTSVTRAQFDGVYLLAFPTGEPALRRVTVLLTKPGCVLVYCDRNASTAHVDDEYDESQLTILGRATRAMNVRGL